ncbi:MAG: class I SAM-dependent methyltransferase [Caldilineaceae bacterium]|nr:class I SAM-dependent methyltransferase [Caldilineaceae bacterium]
MQKQDFTQTDQYHKCQQMFDRWYPNFRYAGQRYGDMIEKVVSPGSTMLDLGCGRMSLAANQFRDAKLSVGVDLGLADLEQNEAVDFTALADGEALPFVANTFDLVISQWAVEHLERPAPVFAEIYRVLKPSGSCILFTTCAYNYVPIVSRLVGGRIQETLISHLLRRPDHESHPTFYRANTPGKLRELSQRVGLVNPKVMSVGSPFYLAFSTLLFRLALLFEVMTDTTLMQPLKLYLLFSASKPNAQTSSSEARYFP